MKIYEIQILMSIIKALWHTAMLVPVRVVYFFFGATVTVEQHAPIYVPENIKHLLSDPLQKRFVNPWPRVM